MNPKYPHISVHLTDTDGNAFAILAQCQRAAKRAGLPKEEVDAFREEGTSDDYDHLLATCHRWFDCI